MIDRTTKVLLAAIALGLWANIIATQIRPAIADSSALYSIDGRLSSIDSTLITIEGDISALTGGTCINDKLC